MRNAVIHPHHSSERFDPDFPTVMRCDKCGKFAHGPRKYMSEALREHQAVCTARSKQDDPIVAQILYPRV